MECPKCDADFEDVDIHDITVKRCTSCQGLWFDKFKHVYLKDIHEDPKKIDIGDEEFGKIFDKKRNIYCPHCESQMSLLTVPDQPHIHYESCSKCYSCFFDAGEFTDFVKKDFIDYIKSFAIKLGINV